MCTSSALARAPLAPPCVCTLPRCARRLQTARRKRFERAAGASACAPPPPSSAPPLQPFRSPSLVARSQQLSAARPAPDSSYDSSCASSCGVAALLPRAAFAVVARPCSARRHERARRRHVRRRRRRACQPRVRRRALRRARCAAPRPALRPRAVRTCCVGALTPCFTPLARSRAALIQPLLPHARAGVRCAALRSPRCRRAVVHCTHRRVRRCVCAARAAACAAVHRAQQPFAQGPEGPRGAHDN
jgi:hypothetical protein